MKLNKIAKILVMSTSTAFAASAFAAIPEIEVNDSTGQATDVTRVGPVTVEAMMGFAEANNSKDIDFYQFTAKEGELLNIEIKNGDKENAPLQTVLVVLGPAPEYKILEQEYVTPGDASTLDARVEKWAVPEDGLYTVGVSRYPTFFFGGGEPMKLTYLPDAEVITDYNLVVSDAKATSVKIINIEVKPGNDEMTPINPRSRGKIPVAILGSSSFSAINVDTTTLTFGSTGDEQSLSKCAKSGEDVNGDGQYDLVCHFENQKAGFTHADIAATLKGATRTGELFEGRAPLKVLPTKAK